MRFLKVYLIAAVVICSICTIIISLSCGGGKAVDEDEFYAAMKLERTTKPPTLPETFLFVAIMSAPNETERRQNVRETWLKLTSKGATLLIHKFPVGTEGLSEAEKLDLEAENEKFGDLAFLPQHQEAYSNLTRKTMASFVYAFENYKFQYMLKVDADSFVRITPLVVSLKAVQHPMLYWGFLDGRAKPFRKGKWKEPEWNICDRYLPYQLGGGYILSRQLVEYLARNSKLFRMYKNEDVSVGAWLGGLDVKYVHDPRFDTEWTSRGCNNEYLITHKKTMKEMKEMFQNLKHYKVLCTKEYQRRLSYVYDFSKPPSECCTRVNGTRIP